MHHSTSHREFVLLPVGIEDSTSGKLNQEAEVRAVTAGDELFVGTSPEYTRFPNDLVYKTLLLTRCVTRLGNKTSLVLDDVKKLHALDARALEHAVYRLTYGDGVVPENSGPGG
jgi:hypothetical protein